MSRSFSTRPSGSLAEETREQGQRLLELDERIRHIHGQLEGEREDQVASTLEDQAQRLNRLKALLLDQASKQANVSPGEFFTHSQFRGDEPTDAPRPFSEFRHGVTQDELPAETICAIWSDVSRLPPLADPIDSWDVAIAVCAGLAGATLDMLAVRIPIDMMFGGQKQLGGPLPELIRKALATPTDNWLGQWAKVPFDRVAGNEGPPIPGMCGRQHRLLSLGHDPLLGLIFGTFDIHRSTITGIDTDGHPFIRPVSQFHGDSIKWALAPLYWIGHILSDVGTKAGLPIPGFGLALLLDFGSFGPNSRTISDIARFMYLKGYDLRHYFAMGLSVGTVEAIVRGYCWVRYGWSAPPGEDWVCTPGEAGQRLTFERLDADFLRHRVEVKQGRLLALAHSLAAGANAIKIGAYVGNPLAINLAQWQRWLWSLAAMAGAWVARQDARELQRLVKNRRAIDAGWQQLLKGSGRDFEPDDHGPHLLAAAPASAFAAVT